MAVWVYKDNEKELIDPTLLHSQLSAGWSTSDPALEVVEPEEKEPVVSDKKPKNKD
jgi:hypothetical protein